MPSNSAKMRLLRALENEDDPGGVVFRQIRDRMVEMNAEQAAALEELEKLNEVDQPQSPDLLNLLPIGEIVPPTEPTPALHRLFEALRLQLHSDYPANRIRCRVTLRSESIDEVLEASANVVRSVVDVFRAPGRNRRTSTTRRSGERISQELVVEGVFDA